jgi:drug/metabolite transporter (DMT)-like permease
MGVLLFFQIATFTWAIAESSSSHSTVLVNTYVLWVAGIEHFITGTMRLTPMKLAGLAFAAAGGLIIFAATEGNANSTGLDKATSWGDFIMLISAFILGIKIVYTKIAARVVPPGTLIFWHDVVGVVLFAAWSACFETVNLSAIHVPTVLGLLYQGVVVAGFCFAVQALLLRKHSASQISIFSFASPLFGIAAAWALRGDPLSPWLFASAACVAVGIFFVNSNFKSAEG